MSRTDRAAERRRAERQAERARRREEERRAEAAVRTREEARERQRQEARRAEALREAREREEKERRRREQEAARRRRLQQQRRQERRQAAKEEEARESSREARRTMAPLATRQAGEPKRRERRPKPAKPPAKTRPRRPQTLRAKKAPARRPQGPRPEKERPPLALSAKPGGDWRREKLPASREPEKKRPQSERRRAAELSPRVVRPAGQKPAPQRDKPRVKATGPVAPWKIPAKDRESPRAAGVAPRSRIGRPRRGPAAKKIPWRRPTLEAPARKRTLILPADNPHPRPGAARLPGGSLSGHLPWLRVEGRFLVDERDRVRLLRGVTLQGLERAAPQGSTFPLPLSSAEAAMLRSWGATVVRLPLAQDLALEGRGEADGEDYLEAVDAAVATAAAAGLYTILQLSLLSSLLPTHRGPGGECYDPPLPDPGSLDFWGILARRYAEEPAVLFQLFGPPHDPGPGDATAGLLPRVTWPVWRNHLLAMLGELRREHPRAVALVPGLGSELSGFPLPFSDGSPVPHLIYGLTLPAGASAAGLGELRRLGRQESVAALGITAGPLEGRQVQALGPRLAQAGIHWLAAAWSEGPEALVMRQRGRLAPTPLGRAFQGALAAPMPAEFHLEPAARRQLFRLLPGRGD